MATKLATGVYQLVPTEGLTLQLSAVGTGFTVAATVDTTTLNFTESGDVVRITPEILGDGIHTVNVRCFFSVGSTPVADYELLVIDDEGSQLDDLHLPIVASEALPYQALLQLALIVRAEAAQ